MNPWIEKDRFSDDGGKDVLTAAAAVVADQHLEYKSEMAEDILP